MAQHGGTHDAGFYCDIEVCFVQDTGWMGLQDLRYSHEFGVACALGEFRWRGEGGEITEEHTFRLRFVSFMP